MFLGISMGMLSTVLQTRKMPSSGAEVSPSPARLLADISIVRSVHIGWTFPPSNTSSPSAGQDVADIEAVLDSNRGISGSSNGIADLDKVRVDLPPAHVAERGGRHLPVLYFPALGDDSHRNLRMRISHQYRCDLSFNLDDCLRIVVAGNSVVSTACAGEAPTDKERRLYE